MEFGHPEAAICFLAVIGLAGLLFRAEQQRRRDLETFASPSLLPGLLSPAGPPGRRLRPFMAIAGLSLCVAALMAPRFGYRDELIPAGGADLIVVVDVSQSMLAEDAQATRFETSKRWIRQAVIGLRGDRVGLAAFSGRAFLVCPLTVDYAAFLRSLDDLEPGDLQRQGTSLSAGIEEALRGFPDRKAPRAILLFTDGEDHEGDAIVSARKAREEGVRLFCVGVGTKEGELVPGRENGPGFLKDRDGNPVRSRLNEPLLQRIALETGGAYVRAAGGTEQGIPAFVAEATSTGGQGKGRETVRKVPRELYQVPLGFGLLLLAWEPVAGRRRRQVGR